VPCVVSSARELSPERFRDFWKDWGRLDDTQWPSFSNVTTSSELSQNVHPQRQHTAQPDGVVDVIGVGVEGQGRLAAFLQGL
jgi:hypothetical protein